MKERKKKERRKKERKNERSKAVSRKELQNHNIRYRMRSGNNLEKYY
jgi:hypothetical protein